MFQKINFIMFVASIFIMVGCEISGTITENGIGIKGVTVTLTGDARKTAVTDENGRYCFSDLESGIYQVTASHENYTFFPEMRATELNEDVQDMTMDFQGTCLSDSGENGDDTTGNGADDEAYSFINDIDMKFNLIPEGTFTMGSPDSETGRDSDEAQHQVRIDNSFYMQITEVTQQQWEAVMGELPSEISAKNYGEGDNYPVYFVSWEDVQGFIEKLNAMGMGTYRLPTEEEWEYACRAGSETAFANGDITHTGGGYDANLYEMGWYCSNTHGGTMEVGQKQPNAWGLYDMHGNVYEWCTGSFGDSSDSSEPFIINENRIGNLGSGKTDGSPATSGEDHMFRGGDWGSHAKYCRSANRDGQEGLSSPGVGFRLVRTL